MWYKNIAGRFFGLVTKHACDRQTDGRTDGQTDRRTDGQNYDSQDRASIAASRCKNYLDAGYELYDSPPNLWAESLNLNPSTTSGYKSYHAIEMPTSTLLSQTFTYLSRRHCDNR